MAITIFVADLVVRMIPKKWLMAGWGQYNNSYQCDIEPNTRLVDQTFNFYNSLGVMNLHGSFSTAHKH